VNWRKFVPQAFNLIWYCSAIYFLWGGQVTPFVGKLIVTALFSAAFAWVLLITTKE
jgi:hypothetical protein